MFAFIACVCILCARWRFYVASHTISAPNHDSQRLSRVLLLAAEVYLTCVRRALASCDVLHARYDILHCATYSACCASVAVVV
jgi:hypothetical protein